MMEVIVATATRPTFHADAKNTLVFIPRIADSATRATLFVPNAIAEESTAIDYGLRATILPFFTT